MIVQQQSTIVCSNAPIAIVTRRLPTGGDTRRILRVAQHRIDRIWAGALGRYMPELAWEACWDVILQAGRDLDRSAAKADRRVHLVMRDDRRATLEPTR